MDKKTVTHSIANLDRKGHILYPRYTMDGFWPFSKTYWLCSSGCAIEQEKVKLLPCTNTSQVNMKLPKVAFSPSKLLPKVIHFWKACLWAIRASQLIKNLQEWPFKVCMFSILRLWTSTLDNTTQLLSDMHCARPTMERACHKECRKTLVCSL